MNKELAKRLNLVEQVKDNMKRLSGCPGPHVFEDITPHRVLGKRFRCSNCQGEVDIVSKHWYDMGFEHGAR